MTNAFGKTICVSGYFDPLHVGHLEYLQHAKDVVGDRGKLVVIVNNDDQAAAKKGRAFMPCSERIEIVRALRMVDSAVQSTDADRTVRRTLELLCSPSSIGIKPDIFANGGDQSNASIPEAETCQKLGIELLDGLGDKVQSSSWLLEAAAASSALANKPK